MPKEIGKTKIYTVREIAEKLELTEVTVLSYIKTHKIKARKLGTRFHVTEKNLEDFLNGRQDLDFEI